MQKYLLYFISLCFLSSCLKNEPFKLDYTGFAPQNINDDWQLSSPEKENIDPNLLEKAFKLIYQDDRFWMARSLLVFRNAKLVAEAYPNHLEDIHQAHNIQSCTKSITSLLVGIAIQDNKLNSLEKTLYDLYPEHFDSNPEKRDITIKDALLMQTGLVFDNGSHTQQLYETSGNSIEFVLAQEQVYPAGTIMKYNDGAPQLISKVIEKKTQKNLSNYAQEKLFEPLGISNWQWEAAKDQTTFGAFSLFLTARDLGKIGQLLLQNGVWNNQTIIDSTYLAEATSILTSANFNSAPYGYYFWILPSLKGYCALGHGGQFLLVVPQKQLIVVYTAFPYTNEQFFDERTELMSIIVESCQ